MSGQVGGWEVWPGGWVAGLAGWVGGGLARWVGRVWLGRWVGSVWGVGSLAGWVGGLAGWVGRSGQVGGEGLTRWGGGLT